MELDGALGCSASLGSSGSSSVPQKKNKLNGQQQKTKLDKMNHNDTKSPLKSPLTKAGMSNGKENETKLPLKSPLAKASMSNAQETEKGKKNKT